MYKDLLKKYESLEKIRKDIIQTVSIKSAVAPNYSNVIDNLQPNRADTFTADQEIQFNLSPDTSLENNARDPKFHLKESNYNELPLKKNLEQEQYPKILGSLNYGSQFNYHGDGKVFFKNVKARLTEDKFNEFLLNIKRLNGKVQSKQQTMLNVAALFGEENDDLLRHFQMIINT